MANSPKQDDSDSSLLNALESIKGLLEQSESKLNAARASIAQATPGITSNKTEILLEDDFTGDEDDFVPVLNDIVIPPELQDSAGPGINVEVLRVFLDEMQKKIEKNMRDNLMQAVVRAEGTIKKQIRAYLDQLRKMLDEKK